jgi:hypothetical protein
MSCWPSGGRRIARYLMHAKLAKRVDHHSDGGPHRLRIALDDQGIGNLIALFISIAMIIALKEFR